MKKALLVASVASMIKQFNMDNIQILLNMGYQVTVATNFSDPGTIPLKDSEELINELIDLKVDLVQIEIVRNPFNLKNFNSYNRLKKLINNTYFDIIHCHSPIGGVLTRLAAVKTREKGSKLVYTAHGFHFFENGPIKNWLFYPIERFLSKKTDVLITINNEDFKRASSWKNCEVKSVPGVGVDTQKFLKNITNKRTIKNNLGLPIDSRIVLSVGELSDRKNHLVGIEVLNILKDKSIHYVICGKGGQLEKLQELVNKYHLKDNVHFLGYINNLESIYGVSDVFLFPSKREGLGLAGIEAMASGLPILTSNINGINDYSVDGETGFSYEPSDYKGFSRGLKKILNMSPHKIEEISKNNRNKSLKYDQSVVNQIMKEIYKNL
ncbi:glycosyltransferase [Facklamia sp. P12934]|uniref:glycosyltransferase n=1 Tax=Facklamia sp. P12934 TaxID=3421948 RepID=UPI003D167ADF